MATIVVIMHETQFDLLMIKTRNFLLNHYKGCQHYVEYEIQILCKRFFGSPKPEGSAFLVFDFFGAISDNSNFTNPEDRDARGSG